MDKIFLSLAILMLAAPVRALEQKGDPITQEECSFLKDAKSVQIGIPRSTG